METFKKFTIFGINEASHHFSDLRNKKSNKYYRLLNSVMAFLVIDEEGREFFLKEKKDLHTGLGMIKEEDLKEGVVESSIGKKFSVLKPNNYDFFKNMKRGPQIITPKDAGYILARTGIDKNSVVVDAGAGTGALTIFLALHAKKVISYEKRKEFFKIAKRNIKFFNLKNVILKNEDVYEGISENGVDVITLDLKEPWRVKTDALRFGGYLVVYVPTINQVIKFKEKCGLRIEEVCEIIKRDWKVGNVTRPESRMIAHTGFLIFCRKLGLVDQG